MGIYIEKNLKPGLDPATCYTNEPSGHIVSNEAVTNMHNFTFMRYVKVAKLIVTKRKMAVKKERGRDAWVVQLVKCLIFYFSSGLDLGVVSLTPALGSPKNK